MTKRLETLKWKKLAREFSKLDYLSYDTLFVKIGAVLFSKNIIHKLGNLVFLENIQKYWKYIPISCTPYLEFICVKTYQILYIGVLQTYKTKTK